jgi:hypothetical protein
MFTWSRGYPLLYNAIPAFVLAKENPRVLELVRVVFGRFLKNLNNFTNRPECFEDRARQLRSAHRGLMVSSTIKPHNTAGHKCSYEFEA